MSREIKFRVWDKIKKIICETKTLKEFALADVFELELAEKQWDNLELMQFTGLKDKNGKEIYEGDILESPISDLVSENEKFVVEYVNGFFARFRQYDESVIIGNIHENPELLNN